MTISPAAVVRVAAAGGWFKHTKPNRHQHTNMRNYKPTPDIPERGNILCTPAETAVAIRSMDGEARLQFVTAQIDWFLTGRTPTTLDYAAKLIFDRWMTCQLQFAEKARKAQANAKAKICKRWGTIPPPTR